MGTLHDQTAGTQDRTIAIPESIGLSTDFAIGRVSAFEPRLEDLHRVRKIVFVANDLCVHGVTGVHASHQGQPRAWDQYLG